VEPHAILLVPLVWHACLTACSAPVTSVVLSIVSSPLFASTELTVEWLALLLFIMEVLSSNLGPEGFLVFLSLQDNNGHCRFLPLSFLLVIH
jgi:hypothetical protein